jgi:hypothetical protein
LRNLYGSDQYYVFAVRGPDSFDYPSAPAGEISTLLRSRQQEIFPSGDTNS